MGLSFVQRGVERMPTNWTAASKKVKKKKKKKNEEEERKHSAINKLTKMVVLFRVKPLLLFL